MRQRWWFVAVFLLAIPSFVSGQASSICPTGATSATVPVNTTLTVTFCAATSDNVVGAWVYGLPTGTDRLHNFVKLADYADGKSRYSGTVLPQPRGISQFYLRAYNVSLFGAEQEGDPSNPPFGLSVVDALTIQPPAAPINILVK